MLTPACLRLGWAGDRPVPSTTTSGAAIAMPYIAALLVLGAVFGLGRCSAPEPDKPGYKVIHVEGDTKTVTKTVPGDMPESCRIAAGKIAALVDATGDIDLYAGRLGDVAERIGIYAEQPGGQKYINERLQEARDLQTKTARIGMTALEAKADIEPLLEQCDRDLKE